MMPSLQPPGLALALAFVAAAGSSLGVRAQLNDDGGQTTNPGFTGQGDPNLDIGDPNNTNNPDDPGVATAFAGATPPGTANFNDPATADVQTTFAGNVATVIAATGAVPTLASPSSSQLATAVQTVVPSTPPVTSPSLLFSTPNTALSSASSSLSASAPATHPSSAASSDKSVPTIPITSAAAAESATGKSKGGSSNAGAIAGGVIGALVVIGLVIAGVLFYRRRQRLARNSSLSRRLSEHRASYRAIGSEPPYDGGGGAYHMEAAYDPPDDRRMSRHSVIDDEMLLSPMPGAGQSGSGKGKARAMSMSSTAGLPTTGEMMPPLIRVQSHPDSHIPIVTVTSSSAIPQAVELQHSLSISGVAGVTQEGKSAEASADLADLEAARLVQESENRAARIREKEEEKEAEAARDGERTSATDPVPPYWVNAGTEEARLNESVLGRAPTYK